MRSGFVLSLGKFFHFEMQVDISISLNSVALKIFVAGCFRVTNKTYDAKDHPALVETRR